jgi:predicted dehydrogenase
MAGTGRRLRWGILGTGKIAAIMAEAIGVSEAGELVAVGSRDRDRALALAERFAARHAPGSYEEVIDDPTVDLVYVALPHSLHVEWAIRAAEAGKAVLCEKPLAVDAAGAAAIVDAARRNGVFVGEGFAYRCHPQTHRLVELVRDGAVGDVRVIDAAFGYDAGPAPTNYLLRPELAGGSIFDVGCYATSMSHLLVAAACGVQVVEQARVSGAGRIGPSGVDLSAAATIVFESGHLARVACSIEAGLDSVVRI